MAIAHKNTALLSRLNTRKLSREEAHTVHINFKKIMISYYLKCVFRSTIRIPAVLIICSTRYCIGMPEQRLIFPFKKSVGILMCSPVTSKHNKFWHLHLLPFFGDCAWGMTVNVFEGKPEDWSWAAWLTWLITAGGPNQEHTIYSTADRAHSNIPVDSKLQEAKRKTFTSSIQCPCSYTHHVL